MIFEPLAGADQQVDVVLRRARERAVAAGWHCWAYRNEMTANEITLFLEGPAETAQPRAIFGTEIQELRELCRRFEPVKSLIEHQLEVSA